MVLPSSIVSCVETEISIFFTLLQEDHKLTLEELNRKYSTDLTKVSKF